MESGNHIPGNNKSTKREGGRKIKSLFKNNNIKPHWLKSIYTSGMHKANHTATAATPTHIQTPPPSAPSFLEWLWQLVFAWSGEGERNAYMVITSANRI